MRRRGSAPGRRGQRVGHEQPPPQGVVALQALEVAAATELFVLAESLGGIESLIEHPGKMTHASVAGTALEVPADLIRLSVGIESVEDLVADLDRALGSVG